MIFQNCDKEIRTSHNCEFFTDCFVKNLWRYYFFSKYIIYGMVCNEDVHDYLIEKLGMTNSIVCKKRIWYCKPF